MEPLRDPRVAAQPPGIIRGAIALFLLVWAVLSAAPLRAEIAPGQQLWENALGHMRADRPDKALPILQALHGLAPDSPAITLELALAHFRLGQDPQARRLLRRASAMDLGRDERRAANLYLAAIENRQKWRFSFSGGLVPQSNASRAAAGGRVNIGGWDFILDERARPGTGLELRLGLGYRSAPGGDLRFGLDATLQGKIFENRAWNDYSLTLDSHAIIGQPATGRSTLGLILRPRWVSDKPHTLEFGPYISHLRSFGPDLALTLRADVFTRHALIEGRDDALVSRFSTIIARRISEQSLLIVSAAITRIDAPKPQDAARIASIGLSVMRDFGPAWSATLSGNLTHEQRDGPSALFGVTRDETERQLRLRISNGDLRIMGFSPVLELGHEQRRSNVEVYSWTNNYLGLSVNRRF